MKPVNVKSGNYLECYVNSREKDPKFKMDDNIRISKIQKHFC